MCASFTMTDKRVLIVDDDKPIRSLLRTGLKKHGIVIDEAPGGQEAIDLLGVNSYDLVLLDLMMPKVNGFDVLAWMDSNKTQTQVFIMSAASLEHIARASSPIVKSTFRKPFDLNKVTAQVLEACGLPLPPALLEPK